MIRVNMRGNQLAIDGLKLYRKKLQGNVERALEASALVVQNEARKLVIKGPKTGRIYLRRTVAHRASAPGQPPASDTGTLVRNIIVVPDHHRGFIRIVANTNYSLFLEKGTRRMKPRPFMIVALNNSIPRIKAIFKAELGKIKT